jgi:Zn-dependent protease with chaperone function
MKLIFLALFLIVLAGWVLWNASMPRLWKWLGARPVGQFPVWRQVKERLDELARQERIPVPGLWVLPEFSPNVLVLHHRGVQIALTEGLLRSLDADELDAILMLSLAHGQSRRRRLQTILALQIFPFARFLQGYPIAVQVFLAPWLTVLLRTVSTPSAVLRSDKRGTAPGEALVVAAALQKMAVLGRKIPFRRWNFALDSLFLISPLAFDGGPFWVFLSQPSIEERRRNVLSFSSSPACESSAGLP